MKIEKDIPVPEERVKHSYPFDGMQVGDSFLVTDSNLAQVCNAHGRAGRRLGRKFTARRVEDGIRVWRIS